MEVDAIQRAIRETEDLLEKASRDLRPGLGARDLADGIRGSAAMRGLPCAWTPKMCPIVTTGPGSKIGHVSPGVETVAPGSVVHVDFGVKVDHYCSDLQRMWFVSANGEGPPEPVQHAFDTIVEAVTKSAEALAPGVQGWEVDQIARDVLTARGYEEYQHALGHQVGRSPHDGGGATLAPRWERYNETPYSRVEQGNVFTLEPSILLPDYGMIALEEMVLVSRDGCRFLSNRQTELPVLHSPS